MNKIVSADYADYAEMKDQRTYRIIGAAIEVHKVLGCGFLEAVYQEALGKEFVIREIPSKSQPIVEIVYKAKPLEKKYQPDFICYDEVIVEIKAIQFITRIEEAQLLNYLKATGFPVGLLVNFGTPKMEWKRYANTRNIGGHSRPFAVNLEGGE